MYGWAYRDMYTLNNRTVIPRVRRRSGAVQEREWQRLSSAPQFLTRQAGPHLTTQSCAVSARAMQMVIVIAFRLVASSVQQRDCLQESARRQLTTLHEAEHVDASSHWRAASLRGGHSVQPGSSKQ
jgi:hypothetical protein